jgi:nitronate monooxygenase
MRAFRTSLLLFSLVQLSACGARTVLDGEGDDAAVQPDVPDTGALPADVPFTPVDVPVIASGGMADGRSLVAALALGAEGVNMGTRFCATVEAQIHPAVKQQIVDFTERDTVLVGRSLRNTARVARNAISEQVAEIQKDPTKSFDDVRELMAGVRGRNNVLRDGDLDGGIWTTGQSQALIHDVPTCAEVVRNIMAQADGILAKRFVAIAD